MGGLASRSYLQGLAKKDGAGVAYRRDVAKLITVDTPHQGAELATLCQQFRPLGIPICSALGIDANSVAVAEMRSDSPALLNLNNLSANPLPSDNSYVSIISTGLKLLLLPDQIGDGIVSTASQNLGNVAGVNLLNHTAKELFVLPSSGCDPLKKLDPLNGDYLSHTCATGDGGVHAQLIRQLRPMSSPAETADEPVPYRSTTLAGLAASSGSADGTGTSARFNSPTGVAVDRVGNIYVADYGNHTIRSITADVRVSTVAGLVVARSEEST